MHQVILVACLVFGVSAVYCDESVLEQWRSHCTRARRFHCRKPQNRSVDIQELVNERTWAEIRDFRIWPHGTVLQRCTSAGSCGKLNSCQPNDIENRQLVFRFKNSTSRKLQYLIVAAEEHISCRCQEDEHAHD